MKLLLFLILLIICWPAALLALVLFPFIWLILLPSLPARALRAI